VIADALNDDFLDSILATAPAKEAKGGEAAERGRARAPQSSTAPPRTTLTRPRSRSSSLEPLDGGAGADAGAHGTRGKLPGASGEPVTGGSGGGGAAVATFLFDVGLGTHMASFEAAGVATLGQLFTVASAAHGKDALIAPPLSLSPPDAAALRAALAKRARAEAGFVADRGGSFRGSGSGDGGGGTGAARPPPTPAGQQQDDRGTGGGSGGGGGGMGDGSGSGVIAAALSDDFLDGLLGPAPDMPSAAPQAAEPRPPPPPPRSAAQRAGLQRGDSSVIADALDDEFLDSLVVDPSAAAGAAARAQQGATAAAAVAAAAAPPPQQHHQQRAKSSVIAGALDDYFLDSLLEK